MNKNIIAVVAAGLVVIAAGGFAFTQINDESSDSMSMNQSQSESVDMSAIPDNLEEVIQTAIARQSEPNVVVLDVRTDEEWNESHATGALHWGLAEHIENGELPPLGRNMEIYVYCRSGNRAGQAIRAMQEAGFTNLTNIRGLEDWVAAGGETTSGVDTNDQSDSIEAMDTHANDSMVEIMMSGEMMTN